MNPAHSAATGEEAAAVGEERLEVGEKWLDVGEELLEAASRLRSRVTHALAPAGLSYESYRVLATLRDPAAFPGDVRPPATHTGAGPGFPEIVAGLEADGLVRVRESTGDVARVSLTGLGFARLADASERLERASAEFTWALSRVERVALGRLLAWPRSPGDA